MLRRDFLFLFFLFFTVSFFFGKSLVMFFAQDDFWLLSISQLENPVELFTFLIPRADAVWYRPLSSQFFFYISNLLFGLKPFGYHVVVLVTHAVTAFVIYKFISELSKNIQMGYIAAYLYVIHQVHTVSVSWLAAYSFIISPLFLMLMILSYSKRRFKNAFFFYLLAVLSHEVAIVGIGFLWLYQRIFQGKNNWLHIILYILPGVGTLILRFKFFPTEITTNAYSISLGSDLFLTLKFYLLRIINVPWFIDGMSNFVKLSSVILIGVFLLYLIWGIKNIYQSQSNKRILFFGGIGCLGLLPFLLYPNHLSPHYLSFSLLGGAPLFAEIVFIGISRLNQKVRFQILVFFIAVYTLLQYIGSQWTYQSHWIFKRAKLAQELVAKRELVHPIGSESYFSLGAGSAQKVYE